MGKILPLLILGISLVLLSACSRTWHNPDSALPAQNVAIGAILANPDAYDMSGVIVIGKIWHLEFEPVGVDEYGQEIIRTRFLLADRKGTGIDVFVPGEAPVSEGDFIKVIGLYRKQFQQQGEYFYSSIDAVRLESWKPGLVYWVREYEFD